MATNHEQVDLCGYRVNLVRTNPKGGALIVLLHGFGAGVFSWQGAIESLSELGEVVAYDRPGFGQTPFPDASLKPNPYGLNGQLELLGAVIEKHRNGRPVVVVGHSAGGQIAAEFAVRNSGVIDLLILEDPVILRAGPPAFVTSLFRAKLFDRLGPRLMQGFKAAGNKLLFDSFYDKTKITQEIKDAYQQPSSRENWPAAFFEFVRAPKTATIQKRLGELGLPVFVISGDHDKIVAVENTFKVTEQIAGHRIYLVPDCGHIPHQEQPEDFLRVVKNFIRERI